MSEPRAEEEKQRIRVELMAEIARNEQDPEQCNEATGRYNREFLYNVRDLEQLCSITECPLEPHQLKEFGLDRSSPCNGLTRWYWERVELIELGRANLAKNEQDLNQLLIKTVLALLNKIRLTTDFDGDTTTEKSLTKEFLDYELYQSPALKEIVSIIVDMAVKEPMQGERLAKLSQCQRMAELQTTGKTWSAFGDALLSRIDELDKGADTDENKQIDSPESLNKLRSRRLGSVIFIGQLVLSGFISFETFTDCVLYPLKSVSVDAPESIKGANRLLSLIVTRLDRESNEIMRQIFQFYAKIVNIVTERLRDEVARIERERDENRKDEYWRILMEKSDKRDEAARIERKRIEKEKKIQNRIEEQTRMTMEWKEKRKMIEWAKGRNVEQAVVVEREKAEARERMRRTTTRSRRDLRETVRRINNIYLKTYN